MISKFDDSVESLYQRFSEWSQVNWGKHCYWWAYICLLMSSAYCLALVMLTFIELGPQVELRERVLETLNREWSNLFLAGFHLYALPIRMQRIKASMPTPIMPREYSRALRILIGVAMILWLCFLDWKDVILYFIWASMLYFDTCHPLPPHAQRNRKAVGLKPQLT